MVVELGRRRTARRAPRPGVGACRAPASSAGVRASRAWRSPGRQSLLPGPRARLRVGPRPRTAAHGSGEHQPLSPSARGGSPSRAPPSAPCACPAVRASGKSSPPHSHPAQKSRSHIDRASALLECLRGAPRPCGSAQRRAGQSRRGESRRAQRASHSHVSRLVASRRATRRPAHRDARRVGLRCYAWTVGRRVNSPRTARIALVLREDERARLNREARLLDITLSELVRRRVFAHPPLTRWATCHSSESSFSRSTTTASNCQGSSSGGRSL